jgi:uncharacterized membrane protein YccC
MSLTEERVAEIERQLAAGWLSSSVTITEATEAFAAWRREREARALLERCEMRLRELIGRCEDARDDEGAYGVAVDMDAVNDFLDPAVTP